MMHNCINDPHRDPLGTMMLDYLHGKQDASVAVDSSTLDMWTMRGETMFRNYSKMNDMERLALRLCEGRILDVGAGSGCHSLYLQHKGKDVDSLDISPGCIQVMRQRRVKNPIHQNFFSLENKKYSTILMLMNGLGICGSIDGCNLFMQFIGTILDEGGQVIADSTDLAPLYDDTTEVDYSSDCYYGETEFVMKYQTIRSEPFQWLYIDYDTLRSLVEFNDLQCEQIMRAQSGTYLVKIIKPVL